MNTLCLIGRSYICFSYSFVDHMVVLVSKILWIDNKYEARDTRED